MGDDRYAHPFHRLKRATDKATLLRAFADEEVIQALAHASRERDPYFANVLATEALNRMRRAKVSLNHVGAGIILTDERGLITDLNPAAERLLGWDKARCMGLDRHATFHSLTKDGNVAPREECPILRVLLTGEVIEAEDCFTRASGQTFPVSYTASPIRTGGEVEGVVIAFQDISARHDVQRERERWHSLLSAFYTVHDRLGIGLVLLDGVHVDYANDAFRDLTGLTLDELRAKPAITDLLDADDRTSFERRFSAIILDRLPEQPERTRLVHRDGARIDVEMLIAKLPQHGREEGPRIVAVISRL